MKYIKLWSITIASVAVIAAAYQTGLHAQALPMVKYHPNLLFLCLSTAATDNLDDCSPRTLSMDSDEECKQALVTAAWVLSAAQRIRVAKMDLGLACKPASDIHGSRPSDKAKPDNEPIIG